MTHVPENNKPAILQDFVKQFYAGTPFIPRELMLQYEIEDAELIEKWLSERKGSRVYLKVPKIGSKEKLVELAAQNAKLVLSQGQRKIKTRRRTNHRCGERNLGSAATAVNWHSPDGSL